MTPAIERTPIPLWVPALFLGLALLALPALLPRLDFENRDKLVDLVVDGRGFLTQAEALGWSPEELASALAKSGVTSVALRPASLGELLERGLVQRLPASPGSLKYRLSPGLEGLYPCQQLARFMPVKREGDVLEIGGGGPLIEELRVLTSPVLEAAFQREGLRLVYRLKNSGMREEYATALLEVIPEDVLVIFDDKEALGYPASLPAVAALLAKRRLRVGLVEFAGQRGVEELARAGKLRMESVHSIPDDEMEKYPLARVLPRWSRAAAERRIRVFYLNPFPLHNLPYARKVGLEANLFYLEKVVAELKATGYQPGPPLHPDSEWKSSPFSFWARLAATAAAGAALGWVLCFFRLLPPLGMVSLCLLGSLILGVMGAAKGSGNLANILALAAACSAPAAAVLSLEESLSRHRNRLVGLLVGLPLTYLVSLAAGLVIGALLSDPGYLTRLYSFRGVKLVYLGPLALVAAYHLYRVNLFQRRLRTIELGMLGLGAVLGVVYLLRSGNFSPIPASGTEHWLRDTMERVLPYRPRTKELALGYPGLGVLVASASTGDVFWASWSSLGATVAGVSATNSFCHLKTPFVASAGRGLVGLLFGIPIALLTAMLHALFFRRESGTFWVVAGFAGQGNIGDDWITRNLLSELRSRCPEDVEVVLLTPSPQTAEKDFGVRGVGRFEIFELIHAFRHADFFCTGPGGLIQDRTSWQSPLYYLGLHALARLLGVPRTAFLGEGFGPLEGALPQSLLRFYTRSADACLVRDEESRILAGDHAIVVPDASLWRPAKPERTELPKKDGPLGLVLREHPEAGQAFVPGLVQSLGKILQETPREIHLLPAFPPEDAALTETLAEAFSKQGIEVQLTPLTSLEARDLAPELSALICMRLHGCLLAFHESIPLLALPYDPKVEIVLKTSGYPYHATLFGPPEQFEQKLKQLLASPEDSLEHLRVGRQRLSEGQERVGECLDQLLAPIRSPL